MDIIYLGYHVLSDDEIVHSLIVGDTEGDENETDEVLIKSEYEPSHSEAFDALDLAFKWLGDKTNQHHSISIINEIEELSCFKKKVNNKAD